MKLKMEIKIGTYIQSNTKNKLKPCIFTFYRIFTCGKRGRGRGVVGVGRHGEASICTSVNFYI